MPARLSLGRLIFFLPRLLVGARRFTMPFSFDRRMVVRGPDFASDEVIGGRRPVQDLLDHVRTLYGRIFDAQGDIDSVALCSPGPMEGRSTLAANLAATMAHDLDREVVLLDLDLREPSLHELLDVPSGPGFAEWRRGMDLDDLLVPTAYPNLRLLRAGAVGADPVPILRDGRLEVILDLIRERGAFAIADTSSLSQASDARIVGERVGGVVTVVKLGSTRRSSLAEYYRRLAGVRLLGVACNYHEDWIPPWLERFL